MLNAIDTFGDVAAEQDAVLEYFLKTDDVAKVESGRFSVVLGRKGSGKTALSKYFSHLTGGDLHVSLTLREYPWSLHAKRRNVGASAIESHVSSWKYVIAVEVMKALLHKARYRENTDSKIAASEFLRKNYGGVEPKLGDLLQPTRLVMSKATFSPSYLGNSIGSIEFEKTGGGSASFGPELEALIACIFDCCEVIASQEGVKNVFVHFDELDQGLSDLDKDREELLTGLVLATRAVKDSKFARFVSPIAYMRTDIWDQMTFSDRNKINRSTALRLEWNAESLLHLINVRIAKKLGDNISWENLDDGKKMRGSQSKWNHIVARTFMRPRDVIQFCNSALDAAKKRDPKVEVFTSKDITAARDDYSPYLKDELDDEIKPHWLQWEEALQAISRISTLTFDREKFEAAYEKRRSKANSYDTDEALKKLFEFSVIGYRGGVGYGGSKWIYRYLEPQAGWDAGSSSFRVHLGLKEHARLQEERNPA